MSRQNLFCASDAFLDVFLSYTLLYVYIYHVNRYAARHTCHMQYTSLSWRVADFEEIVCPFLKGFQYHNLSEKK